MAESEFVTLDYFADSPPDSVIHDLSALQARAYATVGMRGWSASEIRETLKSPAGRLLVAFGKDRAARGFIVANIIDQDGEVLILAVDPDCRRLHVGTRLINDLMNEKNGAKIERLILEVAVTNRTAIKFYQILNFREIGLRRSYYEMDGCKVDAQLMERRSSSSSSSVNT